MFRPISPRKTRWWILPPYISISGLSALLTPPWPGVTILSFGDTRAGLPTHKVERLKQRSSVSLYIWGAWLLRCLFVSLRLARSPTTAALPMKRMIRTSEAFRFFPTHVVRLQRFESHHPLLADFLRIQRAIMNLHE